VLSWFNRRNIEGQNTFTADRSSAATTISEVHTEIRTEFLTWGDEDIHAAVAGSFINSSASQTQSSGFAFDGATTGRQMTAFSTAAASYRGNAGTAGMVRLAEGYHYITLVGACGGGTITWASADSNVDAKCRTYIMVKG
jgi:hypothetical protein